MGLGASNLFAMMGNGTTSSSLMNIGGAAKSVASAAAGGAQSGQASSEASAIRMQGEKSAENILRATSKRRAAARAATAASGVKIDEFSLANEADITQAGESDAALALLNADAAAKSAKSAGGVAMAGGLGGAADSLLRSDISLSNWKGAKGIPTSVLDSRYTDYSSAQA